MICPLLVLCGREALVTMDFELDFFSGSEVAVWGSLHSGFLPPSFCVQQRTFPPPALKLRASLARLTCTEIRCFCHHLCLLATPWLHFRADNTPLWHIRLALQAILSCWSLLPCKLDLCQFIPRLNCQTCSFSATSFRSSFSNQYSGCTRRHAHVCVWHTYVVHGQRVASPTCHCSSALLCVCGDQLFITQPNVAPSIIFPFNLFLVQPFPSQVSLWKRCLWQGMHEGNENIPSCFVLFAWGPDSKQALQAPLCLAIEL